MNQQCGQAAGAGGQGSIMQLAFPLVIFVLVFYFFIIRPQKKRQKQHESLLSSLGRGDEVITVGGFIGTVREIKDDSLIVEIADGVKVRVLKGSVANKRVVVTTEGKNPKSSEGESENEKKED